MKKAVEMFLGYSVNSIQEWAHVFFVRTRAGRCFFVSKKLVNRMAALRVRLSPDSEPVVEDTKTGKFYVIRGTGIKEFSTRPVSLESLGRVDYAQVKGTRVSNHFSLGLLAKTPRTVRELMLAKVAHASNFMGRHE